jgi:hypothetical protein
MTTLAPSTQKVRTISLPMPLAANDGNAFEIHPKFLSFVLRD